MDASSMSYNSMVDYKNVLTSQITRMQSEMGTLNEEMADDEESSLVQAWLDQQKHHHHKHKHHKKNHHHKKSEVKKDYDFYKKRAECLKRKLEETYKKLSILMDE